MLVAVEDALGPVVPVGVEVGAVEVETLVAVAVVVVALVGEAEAGALDVASAPSAEV